MDGAETILFEKIKGKKFRLVTNLVGTRTRFARAVSSKENEIHEKIRNAIKKATLLESLSNYFNPLYFSKTYVCYLQYQQHL